MSAKTLKTERPGGVAKPLDGLCGKGSITGKPSNGAGRELHSRAEHGPAGLIACHSTDIHVQLVDFQQFLSA